MTVKKKKTPAVTGQSWNLTTFLHDEPTYVLRSVMEHKWQHRADKMSVFSSAIKHPYKHLLFVLLEYRSEEMYYL